MPNYFRKHMSDNRKALSFFWFFLLPAIMGVFAIGRVVSIPSDPKKAILLGFSLERLLLLVIVLGVIAAFLFLAFLSLRSSHKIEALILELGKRQQLLLAILALSALASSVFWILPHLPPETIRSYQAYLERIGAVLIYFSLIGAQLIAGLLFFYHRNHPERLRGIIGRPRILCVISIGAFAAFLLLWGFVALTGYGVWPGNAFWGKLGAPIVGFQLIAAYLAGAVFILLCPKILQRRSNGALISVDLLLSGLMWGIAILLWLNQPLIPGKFVTEPRPPNYALYPGSDSAVYDRSAQSMLIGYPMPRAIDKPLYVAYLAALNYLSGSDYEHLITLQVVVMALIPAMLYWLGKSLHSRPLGLLVALLSIFKESNAIVTTNLIQVSNAKMILTEMATMAGVLLFTLAFVRWLKNPSARRPVLWVAGGLLGAAALIRLNILAAIPFLLLAIGLTLKFRLKQWALSSCLLILFTVLSLTPWLVRNEYVLGNPLAFVMSKARGVIISNRYMPVLTDQDSDDPNYVIPLDIETDDEEEPIVEPLAPPAVTPRGERYLALGGNMLDHYLHNLIGITFMLPPTPLFYDATQMIRLRYWDTNWDGYLAPYAPLFLLLTLGLIAFGIGSACARKGVAGSAPLFVVLGYNLSNALSLTSGGRYLVPMDWGAYLYFAIGVMELIFWVAAILKLKAAGMVGGEHPAMIAAEKSSNPPKPSMITAGLVVGLFLSVGSIPVLFESIFAQRYPAEAPTAEMIATYRSTIEARLSDAETDQRLFLSGDEAVWLIGRGLYPRYFEAGDGDLERFDALLGTFDFSRVTFQLLNAGTRNVILPLADVPDYFPNAADVVVVGCNQERYFEALVVIVQAEEQRIYLRPSQLPITCSLAE